MIKIQNVSAILFQKYCPNTAYNKFSFYIVGNSKKPYDIKNFVRALMPADEVYFKTTDCQILQLYNTYLSKSRYFLPMVNPLPRTSFTLLIIINASLSSAITSSESFASSLFDKTTSIITVSL